MKVVNNVLELIGETPVIKLNRMLGAGQAEVYVKLEGFNPGGSIKDRPGLYMIEKAEARGLLKKDSIILEATSGNTGIGLAMAASIKGYPILIVMPENMSDERKKILRAYGAQLLLTPAEEGMPGAVGRARELATSDSRYFLVQQFENQDNAESHEITTAQEILRQMEHKLDIFICGVGSGGTLSGTGKALKSSLPKIKIVAVEPAKSAVLSGNTAGVHKIQGIGAGFIPPVLNIEMVDQIIPVSDEDAIETCRQMAKKEALLLGISSGAAVFAALNLVRDMDPSQKILAIAPDGAEKYMSTELFD
ncbi:MAG: cysteine synthase A [Syntrophomonas sp.]|uniref:Cysteine synthase n=1 Tax=Syntrophomonas wolfei subsp. wolfei (strain DSM 2245B / Goettingen) TaxID=335541 RepID=Q0AX09_SYNWW|nr:MULTISPECIES: cysteine synthase A [Syntrophomonas]ABI68745.1 cysteine synthase [Syntrophomonas wolfei subsp. wolfei str. Goettingen G311]MDD2511560.1 cysteine synthase A [Syntrophomonas sp.]MDD3880062.1 cysteine synthase A [Syntrophomonas sp.]MDD4627526.1 cysteine synthase A [Syntrophomonas sp.]